jgi:Domain of unknown function (DUF4192)
MDTLREEVKSELVNQSGRYNPDDRDVNVRIVEDIRTAINDLADGVIPSAEHIAEVAIATNDNLQIRDFLMGVQLETSMDYVGEYISLLGNVIEKEKAIPLATVFCGYLYQTEQKESALEFLDNVLEIKPDYSLATLLKRVFQSEWPPSELKKMAEMLHPKVVDGIYNVGNGDSK